MRILKKNNNQQILEVNVFTMVNIANNIWRNKNVKKFRELNLNKQKLKELFEYRGAYLCLRSIGFKHDKAENKLYMKEEDFDAKVSRKLVDNLKDVITDESKFING
mmetsp:Transcript_33986/g.28709  ORF Transcript_33986/g.28709 Transcript_33986/m.28709 type:complete len:106 (+) Transcript_33986:385-702(+)